MNRLRLTPVVLLALSCFIQPVQAASVSWDGEGGDGLWSTPLNWSSDTLPNSGDSITISGAAGEVVLDIDFLTSGSFTVAGSGNTLRIANGVTLTVDGIWLTADTAASIVNDGTIQDGVSPGAQIRSLNGATSFTNNNTVNGLSIVWRGIVTNNGTATDVSYSGASATGSLHNYGTLNQFSFSIQSKDITNYIGGTVNATGLVRLIGSANFNNHGTFNNLTTVSNAGVFNNHGTFDNTGGTFQNDNEFKSFCGSSLIGAISGNPVIVVPCPELIMSDSFETN